MSHTLTRALEVITIAPSAAVYGLAALIVHSDGDITSSKYSCFVLVAGVADTVIS
jgi:hypothetical protein